MRKIISSLFIIASFICYGQKDTINENNAKAYFKKIAEKEGTWVLKNEKFDANGKNDFSHFTMQFKIDAFGALEGTISGTNTEKEETVFWKIIEFIDPYTGEIIFIQRGSWGYAVASSSFNEKNSRKAEFELIYYNGAKEKHRDIHLFLDENTILAESEKFNHKSKKWVKQPPQKWKRKSKIDKL